MTGNKINDYSNPFVGNPVQMPPVWKYLTECTLNATALSPYQKMIEQTGKDRYTCYVQPAEQY